MLFLCLSSTEEHTQQAYSAKYLDECLLKIAQEDKDALADLYNATNTAVYAFALSILKNTQDAQDVLQDCFIKIYGGAKSYTSAAKPMAWILTITKNLCFVKMRGKKRYADEQVQDWQAQLSTNEAMQTEDKMILALCMQNLTEQERNILILHAVAGFKHREIAELLSLPLATVLSKYNRTIKKLKEIIAKGEAF